jgi:hypothetical protein
MAERARGGRWNGGHPPLGYKVVKKLLEVEPAEAKIVSLIFDWAAGRDIPSDDQR